MRRIVQPGPAAAPRLRAAKADGRAFSFDLPPGEVLLDAVARAFAREGFSSGVMRLQGGALGPFAYVMPAQPTDARHAAYYSETFRPTGATRLLDGAMTLGHRDGEPFFHGHAFWIEADGRHGGGHILPEATVIAAPIHVSAVGLTGAGFVATDDAETNFKLFAPEITASASGLFHALRLCPNQDITLALEDYCRGQGIAAARLHGGVGSLIGARYADGRTITPFATEMFIRAGRIVADPRLGDTILDIAMVDHSAVLSEGRLLRGDNPILMTLEAVLQAE